MNNFLTGDIARLVCSYLIKPLDVLDSWVKNNPKFNKLEKLTIPQATHALKNPACVIPRNWAKISRNKILEPVQIIESLASNHTPRAIEIIMGLDNWCEIIITHSSKILPNLLKNPYSVQIIDELYKIKPDLFIDPGFNIILFETLSGPGASNIILGLDKQGIDPINKHIICRCQSTQVLKEYIEFAEDDYDMFRYLLQNPSDFAIDHSKRLSSKYINEPKKSIQIIKVLAFNPNPNAYSLLEQILNKYQDALKLSESSCSLPEICPDPNFLITIFRSQGTYVNPSNYTLDLIEKYIRTPPYDALIALDVNHLVFNPNPRAIEIVRKYNPTYLNGISHPRIISNPGAIEFIKSNPEKFIERDELYSNPKIFIQILDRKLINKIAYELY